DLDFPPGLRADDAGVVVLLLRASADRELALTDGPAVSGRDLAGRAVSALDLDHAPGVVHHNGVAFFGHAVLPYRATSGFLRVGHVRGAAGARGRGDDARLLQPPRHATQDILGAKVAHGLARATGDMDGRAHGFRDAADGFSNRPRIIRHADDLATAHDELATSPDAPGPRQRVHRGQDVDGFQRRGFLVEPVRDRGVGPKDVGLPVAVDVVSVFVQVNESVLVAPDPIHIWLGKQTVGAGPDDLAGRRSLIRAHEQVTNEGDATKASPTTGFGSDRIPGDLLVMGVRVERHRVIAGGLDPVDRRRRDFPDGLVQERDVETDDGPDDVRH